MSSANAVVEAMPLEVMPPQEPFRPKIVRERAGPGGGAVVEKPLSTFERLYKQGWLRKLLILAVLAAVWEAYGLYLDNDLLFLTFSATVAAFLRGGSATARCPRGPGAR